MGGHSKLQSGIRFLVVLLLLVLFGKMADLSTMSGAEMKTSRASKRGGITNRMNNLKRLIAEDELEKVADKFVEGKVAFAEFEALHNAYHATLTEAVELTASDTYFQEVEKYYIEVMDKSRLYTFNTKPLVVQSTVPISQSNSSAGPTGSRLVSVKLPPAPQPDVFTGTHEVYPLWKASFKALIGKHDIGYDEKMYYLRKYTSGEAKASIEALFLVPTKESYEAALIILEERFGRDSDVTAAFRKKLDAWPRIADKDSKGLQRYSDYLAQLVIASSQYPALTILDDEFENSKLIQKLPTWMATRWIEDEVIANETFPDFKKFAAFIKAKAKVANHSLWADTRGACNSDTAKTSPKGSTLYTDQARANTQGGKANPNANRTSGTPESKPKACVVCKKEGHGVTKCFVFAGMSMSDRVSSIMQHRLCMGCFGKGHIKANCRNKHVCAVCSYRHPTLLHDYAFQPPSGDNNRTLSNERSNTHSGSSQGHIAITQSSDEVTSGHALCSTMIVPVWISHPESGQDVMVYALLDSQSNTHFVTESVLDQLGVAGHNTSLELTTMHGKKRVSTQVVEKLKIRGLGSECELHLSRCFTRETIPYNRSSIPTQESIKSWAHLSDVQLPPYYNDVPVGLLIGYPCFQGFRPLQIVPGSEGQPFGLRTILGWCVVGPTVDCVSDQDTLASHVVQGRISLRTVCKEIFVESSDTELCDETKYSADDVKFIDILDQHMYQREDGYYECPLPFKRDPVLPNNRGAAMKRLEGLKKRFVRDDSYRKMYETVINENLSGGYAEIVSSAELGRNDGMVWYVPHHSVPKDQNKVRVVFDCSAPYRGVCINDMLLPGPNLLNGMLGILLRFRTDYVAVTCDVQKMYFNFRVSDDHEDLFRFLWWPNGDTAQDPVDYRMLVHIFGAVSSSGVATYGMRKCAADYESKYAPEAAQFVREDFYVDDGATSKSSVSETLDLITATQELMAEGNLCVHKIMSSHKELLDSIPEDQLASKSPDGRYKVLGLYWDVETDVLCVPLCVKVTEPTRRGILSTIASVFDPLGIASPLILQAKLILQELCKMSCSWDAAVPDDLLNRYIQWWDVLQRLQQIQVTRCHRPEFEVSRVEVHYFADASTVAYAACGYIRYVGVAGELSAHLLLGKCKVVPSKPVLSIPRLELMAAVLATRLAAIIRKELRWPDLEVGEYFWTDSSIVLSYIKNMSTRYKVFVANRVQMIHSASDPDQWHHIESAENPADDGSRGVQSSRWLEGPSLLYRDIDWSHFEVDLPDLGSDIEISLVSHVDESSGVLSPAPYKSWISTKKVWSWVIRFIDNCRPGSDKHTGELSVSEMENAGIWVLRLVQHDSFESEMLCLAAGNPVSQSSKLRSLSIFLSEDDQLLRVGGRVKHGSLAYELKHPVILPGDHAISILLIDHFHQMVHHQGRGITAAEIRAHGFWIVGLSQSVKRLIQGCVICRRLRGAPLGQKMADLPSCRVSPSPPFTFVGCDCFGHFITKTGRKENKRYGVMFTCLASRSVHIEVVFSLSSDSFVNSFRRLISVRGPVRELWCDQGTNFIGASKDLLHMGCEMKFNPPASSHFGGVWERQIGSARRVIEGILIEHGSQLDDEGLLTVMAEAASIVNSRPMNVQDMDDPESLEPLTPNHILTMKSKVISTPSCPQQFDRPDLYSVKRWRRVQYLLDLFWSRWKKEVLHLNQRRCKWNKARPNLQTDDIVLVVDEQVHRSHWRLARVVETKVSADGLVRSAKVKMADRSVLARPINKLVYITKLSD